MTEQEKQSVISVAFVVFFAGAASGAVLFYLALP